MNDEEIKVLDLFSGIGGFSLGLERASPAFQTVAFCERDPFAQRVLKKHWPEVPIFDDVKTIPTDGLGRVDMVTGGFPCQPWSVAGKREGAEDKEGRDLWPAMVALVEKLRPQWLIGENVRGFVNEPMGLERSLSDLESIGYQAVPFIIPACSKNAPHRRDRVWILGYTKYDGQSSSEERGRLLDKSEEQKGQKAVGQSKRTGCASDNVADTKCVGWSEGAEVRKTSKGKGWTDNSCNSSISKSEAIANTKSYGSRRVSGELVKEGETKKGRGVAHVLQESVNDGQDVADTNSEGFQRHSKPNGQGSRKQGRWQITSAGLPRRKGSNVWLSGSKICRVANGVSRRLDEAGQHKGWENGEPEGMQRVSIGVKDRASRLKTLGNAVVPQVVEQIGKAILEGIANNE
tara:strand:+ start:197 stop:1408 length:1212 start_codon:yes stop_codon:yes gene_type:complete